MTGARGRRDTAGMVVGQLLLAVAAVFSLPLGARDGGGVSSILPPLRSTVAGPDAVTVAAERRRADDERSAVAAVRRIVRPRARRLPHRPAPVPHPPVARTPRSASARPWRSRAPPLVG